MEKVPVERSNKQETFKALCDDFGLDGAAFDLIMASPMTSLQDLRYYFAAETEIGTFLAEDKGLTGPPLQLQTARLRRAWAAIRQHASNVEATKRKGDSVELDDLLEDGKLRDVWVVFWQRHRLRYPTDVMPCDQLVSRCFRELERRILTVFDIWAVRNLMYQVSTDRKRRRVAAELFVYEDATSETPAKMGPASATDGYLGKLYTYLLALGIVGAAKLAVAPTEPEAFGTNPAKYVQAPWDALQQYYFRAARGVLAIPEGSRAAWLERNDVAERAGWVADFRDGSLPLGQVVQEVMAKRSAHWEPPPEAITERAQQQTGADSGKKGNGKGAQQSKERPPVKSQTQSESVHRPGEVATALRDGTKLCSAFQKEQCNAKGFRCPEGVHKCGRVGSRGRVCGMLYHGANKCKQK
jgi:hypothetical protein